MYRKPIIHLLILTLMLLAACSQTGDQPTAAPTSSPVVASATPTPTQAPDLYADVDPSGQVVRLWHPWNQDNADVLAQQVAAFNAQNEYGIRVELQGYDTLGKLAKAVSAGIREEDLPQITVGYSSQYRSWQANGLVLADLNPLVNSQSYGMDEAAITDYFPAVWQADAVDEARYGIPAVVYGQVLFYNQSWAQQLGFSQAPATSEEFRQQACAASTFNGDGTGGWFANSSASGMLGWLYAFGAGVENPKGGYFFNSPPVSDAFTFLAGLYAQGCAWSPPDQYPNPEFAARPGLFYTSSITGIPYQVAAMAEAGNDDIWQALPFFGPDGQKAVSLYGPSFVVLESSPEADLAAWLFLKYLQEPDNQLLWVRANSSFALQHSVADTFMALSSVPPQLAGAMQLAEYGKMEPRQTSWGTVYGALADASAELFNEDFDPETLPQLIQQLQATSEEIQALTW